MTASLPVFSAVWPSQASAWSGSRAAQRAAFSSNVPCIQGDSVRLPAMVWTKSPAGSLWTYPSEWLKKFSRSLSSGMEERSPARPLMP